MSMFIAKTFEKNFTEEELKTRTTIWQTLAPININIYQLAESADQENIFDDYLVLFELSQQESAKEFLATEKAMLDKAGIVEETCHQILLMTKTPNACWPDGCDSLAKIKPDQKFSIEYIDALDEKRYRDLMSQVCGPTGKVLQASGFINGIVCLESMEIIKRSDTQATFNQIHVGNCHESTTFEEINKVFSEETHKVIAALGEKFEIQGELGSMREKRRWSWATLTFSLN